MSPLLAFYYGSHPDDRGRYLAEIVKQDDSWLEIALDYIQWIFPLTELSMANRSAPLLTNIDIAAFTSDELLRTHMRVVLHRMLKFYGLQFIGGKVITGSDWAERKDNWFAEPTHNNLRITRILKSLSTLGLGADARLVLDGLEYLVRTEPDCGVPEDALAYWRGAVTSHKR